MFFMSMISHLLSAWFAFLLPCYGTWKALSHRPISEPEIERWGMYWAVIGVFVAFEYVAEWLISWFPFYWETKTLLLLFLALPQTQNETEIDASLVAAQANLLAFVQSSLNKVWERALGAARAQGAAGQASSTPSTSDQSHRADPLAFAKGLWNTYGPTVVGAMQSQSNGSASGASVHTPAQEAQRRLSPQPQTSPSPSFPEPEVY